ncbi:MAG TPA: metalloregulator ArsR/SmtB family transcription factor [Candidatus Limnocylindrales bacterium]|nr:metalloregulator ArsR/SmtB family transcription factor [Candidatus Limnocylindrales bacterium]
MAKRSDPDSQLLHALADPTRLGIVRQLASEREVCACDLTACCQIAQPTVSHHLKVLREAGVVDAERRGSWVYYRLRPQALERLSRLVAELVPLGAGQPAGRRLPVVELSA